MKKNQALKLIKQNYSTILGKHLEGMIHNLNTPLNNILGYAILGSKKYPQSTEFEKIITSAKKIDSYLKKISSAIDLYRTDEKQLVSISDFVQNELQVLEHSLFFKHNVKIDFNIQDSIPKIWMVYKDLAIAFSLVFDTIHVLLDKEDTKTVGIFIKDEKDNVYLQFTIVNIVPFSQEKQQEYKEKLLQTENIVNHLLQDYEGSFYYHNDLQKTTFVIQIPIGVNQNA